MKPRDLAANLEFWSGRGRTNASPADAQTQRPSFRPSRFRRWCQRVSSVRISSFRFPPGRGRQVAAAAVIAALTAAWLIVGHQAPSAPAAAPVRSTTPSAAPTRSTSSTTVPVSADCRSLSPTRREVRCVIDAIAVDVRLLSSASVGVAYRRASGAAVAARSGNPACAGGAPDERAWSVAAAPISAIGRYRCRFEHGRAAMWWTHGDRLVHAVAPDADLAALFVWWRRHSVE